MFNNNSFLVMSHKFIWGCPSVGRSVGRSVCRLVGLLPFCRQAETRLWVAIGYVYKLVFSFYYILATKINYWLTLRLKSHSKANLLLLLVADPHVSISNWSVNWSICPFAFVLFLFLSFYFSFLSYFCWVFATYDVSRNHNCPAYPRLIATALLNSCT